MTARQKWSDAPLWPRMSVDKKKRMNIKPQTSQGTHNTLKKPVPEYHCLIFSGAGEGAQINGLRLGLVARFVSMALLVLGSGCATQYVHQRHEAQFLPDPVDSQTPIACHLVLTQTDPFVAARKTLPWQAPVMQPGLVNIAITLIADEIAKGINDTANEVRREQASRRSVPLQGHGLGAWFENNLQSSLTKALNSSSWLHPLPLETRRENKPLKADELARHPILDIRLIYNLSFDASALVMQARVFYYKQGETNTEHVCYYTYFSEPIGPEKGESAVAKWNSADDQLLRQRMTEGLNQIVAMLNIDFLRPEWRDPNTPSETISCWDALSSQRVKLKGHTLRKGGSRIIFQTEKLSEQASYLYSLIPN